LEIETWEESAWVSVVPFRMAHVRPRWLPSVGLISDFLELNFRTYVRREGRPGIYFFSIHAGRPAAVRLARWLSPLPYAHARITCTRANGRYRFGSACTHAPSGEQLFSAEYSPKCEESAAAVGSLDEWLLERYRLYVEDRSGRLLYTEVHHEPWQVRNAELTIFANLVGKSFGVELSRAPDHVHFSRGLPAIAWSFEPIDR
jgi:uncharacterized protein YqjF (DUF2071 family)